MNAKFLVFSRFLFPAETYPIRMYDAGGIVWMQEALCGRRKEEDQWVLIFFDTLKGMIRFFWQK